MTKILAPLPEIALSLIGSFRLACGDARGIGSFNITHQGFWRSFSAALIVFPIFALLLSVRYLVNEGDVNIVRFMFVYLIAYIIGWIAFPLLANYLTIALNVHANFIRYIVAYNWASVVQNIVYLPFVILVEARLIHEDFSIVVGVILLTLVFLYTWFVTKTALEVTAIAAVGIVILDLMLSIVISSIAQGRLA